MGGGARARWPIEWGVLRAQRVGTRVIGRPDRVMGFRSRVGTLWDPSMLGRWGCIVHSFLVGENLLCDGHWVDFAKPGRLHSCTGYRRAGGPKEGGLGGVWEAWGVAGAGDPEGKGISWC
jgi:hypothetical protein